MPRLPVVSGSLLVSVLCGCLGSQQARLYDLKSGQSSTLVVIHPRANAGGMEGSLPNGDLCRGSFSEVSSDTARQFASSELPLSENADVSVAVLDCGPEQVLECELARRPYYGFSYGACKDHRGASYSVLF
jgi:hypothetical protein